MIYFVISFIIIFLFIVNVRIVPEKKEYIVERLGKYKVTWQNGIHVKVPFIDRIIGVISLKEKIKGFSLSKILTKDNKEVIIDLFVYFKIENSFKYFYENENPLLIINLLIENELRNLVRKIKSSKVFDKKDKLENGLVDLIKNEMEKYGIQFLKAEIKSVTEVER